MKKFKEIMVVCVSCAISVPYMMMKAVGYIAEKLLMALIMGIKEVVTGDFWRKVGSWYPYLIERKIKKQRETQENFARELRVLACKSVCSGESMDEYCRKVEELKKKHFK